MNLGWRRQLWLLIILSGATMIANFLDHRENRGLHPPAARTATAQVQEQPEGPRAKGAASADHSRRIAHQEGAASTTHHLD